MVGLLVQNAISILSKRRCPLNSYEIPDPFATFVAKKYASFKGMRYDFFAKEWYLKTACCGEELYAPNKKTMTKIRLFHTRNECLGGY